MIVNGGLFCREQNLTVGEVTYFMGCRDVREAETELEKIRGYWPEAWRKSGPIVVYGIAGDEDHCYVFTPENLVRYLGYDSSQVDLSQVYTKLLERVKLNYCEKEDKSDYYSVLELYMDLGDILAKGYGGYM